MITSKDIEELFISMEKNQHNKNRLIYIDGRIMTVPEFIRSLRKISILNRKEALRLVNKKSFGLINYCLK